MQNEYQRRETTQVNAELYSPFNQAHLFSLHQRQWHVLDVLRAEGMAPLEGHRILEVGCGRGDVLLEYLGYGACSGRLHGVELMERRLGQAQDRLPHLPLTCADGQTLPYASGVFDLIIQYTAFSSILDAHVKANVAAEMRRVLRPGGLILWYDFWLNPTNRQTRGIRPAEVRNLFAPSRVRLRKITLAPPVARRLVPVSRLLCEVLEKATFMNTHYLAAIRPTSNGAEPQ